MKRLRENLQSTVDLSVVLMIGIAFAGLTVIAFIIWTIYSQFLHLGGVAPGSTAWPWSTSSDTVNASMNTTYWAENSSRASLVNITGGFDDAVNLILVAITIFILAIAIAALLMLRGGRGE